jgi:hypothetical protein
MPWPRSLLGDRGKAEAVVQQRITGGCTEVSATTS